MKIKWQEGFYYTKAERNGILILSALVIIIFLLPKLLPYFLPQVQTDFSEFEQAIKAINSTATNEPSTVIQKKDYSLFDFDPNTATKKELLRLGLSEKVVNTLLNYRKTGAKFSKKQDLKKIYGFSERDYLRLESFISIEKAASKNSTPRTKVAKQVAEKKKLSPFYFNPNTISKDSLLELGLSSKVVQTVVNYRTKGGIFYHKADFKKIYGLREADYLTLAPYIQIPSKTIALSEDVPRVMPSSFEAITPIKIDVNQSSLEDWQRLRGIGVNYAKRIVNFRNKLGGFYTLNQISTTYGIPDSVIQKVRHQLVLSPITNKIPINIITAEELRLHPYISSKQAQIIVNYRTNHGKFKHIEDLKKVKALSHSSLQRIAPYLSFN